jgi:hypothetical protein
MRVENHGKEPQSGMVEGSRVPEICLLECLLTHLGKNVIAVWGARFHVNFFLPIHVNYWKLILPPFENLATGLLLHGLRNHL